MKILAFAITRILGGCNRLNLLLWRCGGGRPSGEHGMACQPTFLRHHSNKYCIHICQITHKEPWEKVFWTWCVKGLIYRPRNALVMTSPELVQCPTESWSSTEMGTSVPSHFHHLVLGHHIWHFAMLWAGHGSIRQGPFGGFQITLPTFQRGYYLLPLHVLILALNPCLLERCMFSCPRHGCHLSLPTPPATQIPGLCSQGLPFSTAPQKILLQAEVYEIIPSSL